MKSFRNFLVKSTSECYFWLANKVSSDSNEYFLKFSSKVFRISFRPKKSLLGQTFDSNFKILKSFRNFLVKSTSECYFWLANKVSTDSNEYFLKFSSKVFRISFRPKKSLLGQTFDSNFKILKSFRNFCSKVHQNAISDLQTKFQLILMSTFLNFHQKSLESVLGRKSHF